MDEEAKGCTREWTEIKRVQTQEIAIYIPSINKGSAELSDLGKYDVKAQNCPT